MKNDLKNYWKHDVPQIAKAFLNNKNNARGIRSPDFLTQHSAALIKIAVYWGKNKQICP